MSDRLNTQLDEGVKALLVELAGGERKVGAYLSALIRDVHAQQIVRSDAVRALAEQVQAVSKRLAKVEDNWRMEYGTRMTMQDTLAWINEQLPDALRKYDSMPDEEKASVANVGDLMPPPPWLTEVYALGDAEGYEEPTEPRQAPAGAQDVEP